MPTESQTLKTYTYHGIKKNKVEKKIQSQVAAILIIGGKLKILSGDLHTHG